MGCNKITMEHFEWAKDKIMMGNKFVVFLRIIETFYSQPSSTILCLVSTERSYVLKQTCSFQLQGYLSKHELLVDTGHQRFKKNCGNLFFMLFCNTTKNVINTSYVSVPPENIRRPIFLGGIERRDRHNIS